MSDLPALFSPDDGPQLAGRIVAAVILQAVRDAKPGKSVSPAHSNEALAFLNDPNVRLWAGAINIALPEEIDQPMLASAQTARLTIGHRHTRRGGAS